MLLLSTIIILSLSIVFGFIILLLILLNRLPGKGLVVTHALLSVVGLLLLIIYMIVAKTTSPIISAILLVVAAAMGVRITALSLKRELASKWVAILHFIIKLMAVGLLFMTLVIRHTAG